MKEDVRQARENMLDQLTEKAIEEQWPKIQKVFNDKVGPAVLATAQNDEMMRMVLEGAYTAFMNTHPLLRFAIKKEAFVMFCFKHRDRLIEKNFKQYEERGRKMFCANCGEQMDDDSTFCGGCGSVAEPEEQPVPFDPPRAVPTNPPEVREENKIFCGNCGERMDDDSTFCGGCGNVVETDEQPVSFSPPIAAPTNPPGVREENKIFCDVCGERMDDGSTFCGGCGSVAKPEEQPVSFDPFVAPRVVPTGPYPPELPDHPSVKPKIPVWLNKRKQVITIAALVIVLVVGGLFAWKIWNDRKLEAAEQARIADEQIKEKQAEEERQAKLVAEQARIAQRQFEEAEQARIAAEQALAAAEQARAAAEQARAAANQKPVSPTPSSPAPPPPAQASGPTPEQIAAQVAKIQAGRNASPGSKTPAPPAANPQSASKVVSVNLTSGTPINVITSSTISTENSKTGEGFEAVLNEDITYDGRVVARRGSIVKGVISESDPGGRVRGVATISLRLTVLTLTDGRQVSITTNNHTVEASSTVGKDAAKTGVGAGIGAAIGAIAGGGRGAAIGAAIGGAGGAATALATRGDPAVITQEKEITFNLTLPLSFVLK